MSAIFESNSISLEDYEKLLKKHDWYYQNSDDARIFNQGLKSQTEIIEKSMNSKKHEKLYRKYKNKHSN